MLKKKNFNTPLIHGAFRLSEDENKAWRNAADYKGISLNDFLRNALKNEVEAVMASVRPKPESTELLRQILEAIKELKR